ncbi:MAG: PKD domain-containing protein [Brumimicrobium sp.]|nr:PKD domain-containing protein [Brumimicrobium sp.]
MKYLLLFASLLFFTYETFATHIIGGSLTYEHLGGSSYNVRLKLYRDCGPGNVAYPSDVTITVRNGLGNSTGLNFTMPRLGIIELDPPIDSCAVDPGICVEEAVFSSIVNLPPSATGYHLYWGICCRNGSVQNIVDPLNVTEMFHTYIPNNSIWLTNSSPSWVNFPPVFVCQGEDVDFDHSATDADGDSLVYSLYTPYQDNNPTYNASPAPDNIQFTPVPWVTGFSANNPLNLSGTPLVINPVTGLLTGIPEDIGQFIVGIKCEEYRNGVKIGVIVRDFQFNVVDCPPAKDAAIGPVTGCAGNTVDMINASAAGASDFYWEFGDGSPGVQAFEPTHTYPGIGDYTIMLIAQYNTVCADTAYYDLVIGGVTADMPPLDSTCINSSVNFSENSTTVGNMVVDSWQWNFGDGSPVSTIPNPSHVFNASGDLTVQLVVGTDAGCYDTITRDIFVQGLPDADVGPDTTACFNNPNINLNGVITNATGGVWVGNGGSFNPNTTDLNANYDPDPAEISAGSTFVILSTTGNGFCPSNQDTLFIDFIDGPTVDAGPDQEVCADTSSVPLSGTFQYSGGVEWYTVTGQGSFGSSTSANTVYFPHPNDVAADSVQIFIQTTINGNCFGATDSMWIFFFDPPTISLVYPDTICANNPVVLDANSTTGSGIWSTAGDGQFTSDTSNTTTYIHGPLDLSNGEVEIYFESINNGGCQIQRDTINVTVLPSPEIDFTFSEECYGKETEFTSTVTSTDPITGYSWIYDGTQFSTDPNPNYILPDVGTNDVTAIVYSQNGCSDTITKPVFTFYLPVVDFNTPAPCLNGGTQYFDGTTVVGDSAVSWEWNFGDGNSSSDQNPLHQYGSANDYNVQLIVTTSQGCVDSLSNLITIFPGPDAAFSATPSNAYVFENINFIDLSTSDFPLVSWLWDFDDGNFSVNQNTSYNYSDGGDYEVMLVVEDSNGCIDTAKNIVHIYLPPIVPTGFSPNGDNNNDFLFVYGGPYETLDFKVYNNWGEVIFESNDASIGWDGKYKDVDQPIGVYVWTVKAVTNDGKVHELSGDTSLIR